MNSTIKKMTENCWLYFFLQFEVTTNGEDDDEEKLPIPTKRIFAPQEAASAAAGKDDRCCGSGGILMGASTLFLYLRSSKKCRLLPVIITKAKKFTKKISYNLLKYPFRDAITKIFFSVLSLILLLCFLTTIVGHTMKLWVEANKII